MFFAPKSMTKKLLFCSFPLFLFGCDNKIEGYIEDLGENTDTVCEDDISTTGFKQVAYWSESDEDTLEDIDFSMLTHIIYNKVSVDSSGNLTIPDEDEFEDMIDYAHDNGIYAMASIGNSSDSAFNAIAASDDALDDFSDNLTDLIKDYDLDGIDINWQFPYEDEEGDRFENLMKEVDDVTSNECALFSYVVSGDYSYQDATDDGVQDDVLDYGDFLNVMALDTIDDDDLHSSYADAQIGLAYWTARGVDSDRLILAIPAYSDGSGALDFGEIVGDDLDNACVDEASNVEDENGNEFDDINYNGIPTVTSKTEYAQNNAGGVILRSLEQDYFDDNGQYSLLATIYLQVLGTPNDICDN